MERGTIRAICLNPNSHINKHPVPETVLISGRGLSGDAHPESGYHHLTMGQHEILQRLRESGVRVGIGSSGENLVVERMDLFALAPGRRLRIGSQAIIQVTTSLNNNSRKRLALVGASVRRSGRVSAGMSICTDRALDATRYAVLHVGRSTQGPGCPSVSRLCAVLDRMFNGILVSRSAVPPLPHEISTELQRLCEEQVCDLVVAVGGKHKTEHRASLLSTQPIDPDQPPACRGDRRSWLAGGRILGAAYHQRDSTLVVDLGGHNNANADRLQTIAPHLMEVLNRVSGLPQPLFN